MSDCVTGEEEGQEHEGIKKGKEGEKKQSLANKTHVVGYSCGSSRANCSFVDVGGEEEGLMGRAQCLG